MSYAAGAAGVSYDRGMVLEEDIMVRWLDGSLQVDVLEMESLNENALMSSI